jgi:serine/threonine protein kinase
VHRDIKPQNMLFGLGEEEKVLYLIDFGLSIQFEDKFHVHISRKLKNQKGINGTRAFASIATHLRI